MGQYDKLFEPIRVGGVTIPNRIVRTAHGMPHDEESLTAYLVARAKGGVGMQTISATSVHPSARFNTIGLYNDSVIPLLSRVAAAVHRHEMKLFHQIFHPGAGHYPAAEEPEYWSASEIANPLTGIVPHAITKTQIDDLVAHFAAAARRVRDAGLDGVDIHASSGYLLHEFLSPALNQRTDDYGGTPENRMRLLVEVIQAIRTEVGPGDFAVGVRLPNEDYVPGGLTAELNREVAATIDPLVDYVSLHMGSYWRFHKLIAPADDPLGVEMPANEVITPVVTKPTIVVGRIATLDHANYLVTSGQADMVSMVRALMADPELVNKARRGEEARVRPCIGTNQGCVGRSFQKLGLSCVVNMANGREARVALEAEGRTENPKRILVVGGGPAGMEFARAATLRGHRVELHEATKSLGGQVNMAASAPRRNDLGAITRWLADELEHLQVAVRLNSLVDADMVREIAPDEVVLATGSTPRTDGFQVSTPAAPMPGHDLPHVHTSWDVLGYGDGFDVEGPVLVYDDTGSFEAISVAEVLLKTGAQVTTVSRFSDVGANLPFPAVTAGAARERLMSGNFDFIGRHYVREIREHETDIGVLYTDRVRTIPARTVVLVTVNQPNRWLAQELREMGYNPHLIGDVQGKDSLLNAIHTGESLGRVI
jgi:2,4-dienoyl-CoA reductase-like NADH-dependent reductase (Old Yellow Enzyme family)